MACNCPLPNILTDITGTGCPENLGQIQRLWFVRKTGNVQWDTVDPTATGKSSAIVQPNLPTVLAGWNALYTAVAPSDEKLIATPLFGGDPQVNPAEPVFQGGGDNSTLNGKQYYLFTPDSTFTARFDELTAEQTKQLKDLACEDLEVYFITDNGSIVGMRDPVDSDLWKGIPITTVPVTGSRSVQGFAARDSNTITFQLDADWDTYFEKQLPTDFNALTVF